VRTDGSCLDNYVLTRTWTATDRCGNTSTQSQVITVQDTTAPEINCPTVPVGPIDICNDPVPPRPNVTATDNCDPDPSVDYDCCFDVSGITRTWTAMDRCGNEAEDCVQQITFTPACAA